MSRSAPRKVSVVRYMLGGRVVVKGTPGAVRVCTTSKNYYATLMIEGKRRTVRLGTPDLGRVRQAADEVSRPPG